MGHAAKPKSRWPRRVALAIAAAALAVALYHRLVPRPSELPLATIVDGPPPAGASGAIVYLHGLGQSNRRAHAMVGRLRDAGLPASYSVVLLEAPFGTWFGQSWGASAEEQAESRARIRTRLRELLGDDDPPRLVIAGFSQGAGMAIDVAAEEHRVSALASFAPCFSWLRGELPKRDGLDILLAHGTRDERCPVTESRSLAGALEQAGKSPRYIELDVQHEVPDEAVAALVDLALR
jgi:predicted esterase